MEEVSVTDNGNTNLEKDMGDLRVVNGAILRLPGVVYVS